MMRKKEMRVIISFHTTTDAMAMEKYCHINYIGGRLIPTPRQITADCGMSWSAPLADRAVIIEALNKAGIESSSIDELLL